VLITYFLSAHIQASELQATVVVAAARLDIVPSREDNMVVAGVDEQA